jgi:DNA segregation ATPase FtsK/SpoIIIE, S-DNA-T family
MNEIALEIHDNQQVFDVWLPYLATTIASPALLEHALAPKPLAQDKDPAVNLIAVARRTANPSTANASPPAARLFRNTRTNEVINELSLLTECDVLHGDQLIADIGGVEATIPPSTSGLVPTKPPQTFVEVMSGPQRGQSVAVSNGSYEIGRTEASAICLLHPSVSRSHARLLIDDERTSIVDCDSANGTTVNGIRVGSEPVALFAGAVVEIGDIVLAFHDQSRLPAHLQRNRQFLVVNRPPRVQPLDSAKTFAYPRPPQSPTKRSFPIVTIIVPLLVAGAMAFLISPTYLLLGLASPALMIGSLYEDRRTGRKTIRSETARWRAQCVQMHESVRVAHEHAHYARRLASPSGAVSAGRIVSRTTDVWQVRPSHSDFLTTSIGLGDLASIVKVTVPDQGDENLRVEALSVAEQVRIDRNVPLRLELRKLGTIGIVGPKQSRAEIAFSQIFQLVSAHTPQDVQIVVLSPLEVQNWEWCKWLPHCVVDGELAIATTDGRADALFHAVLELAEARVEARAGTLGTTIALPHLVVIIEPPIPVAPRDADRLCEVASDAGITVIWLATEADQLPGSSRAVIRCGNSSAGNSEAATDTVAAGMVGSVVFPESGERYENIRIDAIPEELARRSARALSAWRNSNSADDRAGIPTKIDLFDLMDPIPSTGESIATRWEKGAFGVNAVLGRGFRGPISLDLRADGPHALVAGTTGSGKSELLQAWVGALAAQHPPTRVTFVLIDYKGGAAFKDCIALPHTVGFVTDLDPQAGVRAMVSLNAEITRREHILADHGAKDLLELEARNPQNAPPALVLIVDEFAALKSELPDFVNGLIDIAQRGRSLGIHLILATQKPGGVVDPKIQANTNLRIALRMANANESQDVLGRPLAASISRRTPGRAFVRIGESQLFEMQAAYVGAAVRPSATSDLDTTTKPRLFSLQLAVTVDGGAMPMAGRTHLQRLVEACGKANTLLALPLPTKPWADPLPQIVRAHTISQQGDQSDRGLSAAIGLADEPATQTQYPFHLDLTAEGNVAIYGGPGIGKTTFLRTLAVQLCENFGPDRLHLYGLDFGSRGLLPLERLPQCGGVVTGDQLDRVRRLIDMASAEMATRQEQLAEVGAGTLAELERASGKVIPSMVILIDGFGAFWQSVEPLDRSEHVNKLLRIAADGRSVGIHLVYTADRRSAVVPALSSVTGSRFVMNIPSPEEYASLGFPHLSRTAAVLAPGRFVVRDGLEVQTALICDNGEDGVAQSEEITKRAEQLKIRLPSSVVPTVRELPNQIHANELPTNAVSEASTVFAVDDQRRGALLVDFGWNPLFFVVGPDQSGRTTALRTLTRGLLRTTPNLQAHFVSARRNPLGDEALWTSSAVGPSAADRLGELRATIEARVQDDKRADHPLLIVVDDGDEFTEGVSTPHLEVITKSAREAGTFVIASMSTFRATRAFCVWVPFMRSNRHGILLQPGEDEGEIFNVRLPKRTGLLLPPGRGYVFQRGNPRLAQVLLDGSE